MGQLPACWGKAVGELPACDKMEWGSCLHGGKPVGQLPACGSMVVGSRLHVVRVIASRDLVGPVAARHTHLAAPHLRDDTLVCASIAPFRPLRRVANSVHAKDGAARARGGRESWHCG